MCVPSSTCPTSPSGTEGKVILANGFNWQRYRVLFSNGTELADLDQRTIEPIGGRQAAGEGRRQGLSRSSDSLRSFSAATMHRFGASGSGERRRGVLA